MKNGRKDRKTLRNIGEIRGRFERHDEHERRPNDGQNMMEDVEEKRERSRKIYWSKLKKDLKTLKGTGKCVVREIKRLRSYFERSSGKPEKSTELEDCRRKSKV